MQNTNNDTITCLDPALLAFTVKAGLAKVGFGKVQI